MFLNIRSSLSIKLYQYIISFVILAMLLGPLASFFTKRPVQLEVVIASSPHHDVTLKEVVLTDPTFAAFVQFIPEIKAEPSVIEPAVHGYLDKILYRDFFQSNDLDLSDELSWNLVLRGFGSQLTKENQEQLEHYIRKNFSSKKHFLNFAKNQFLTRYVKRSLLDLGASPAPRSGLDRANESIIRHVDVYTFDVGQAKKTVDLPQVEDLQAYYELHKDDYFTNPLIKAQFLILTQQNYHLSQEQKETISEELAQNGYTDITNELIQEYAAFKYFERLEEIAPNSSEDELLAFLQELGFDYHQHVTKTDFLTEDELDNLVGYKGLFNVGQMLDPEVQGAWKVLPTENGGCVLIKFDETMPARQRSYAEASADILNDWMSEQSYYRAQQQAEALKQDIIAKGSPAVKDYQEVKRFEIQNFFAADQGANPVPDKIKVLAGKLFDPRVDAEHSAQLLVDKANQQVQLVVMASIDIDSSKKLAELNQNIESHFSQFVQESFYDRAFDNQLKKEFGYKINPEFWSLVYKQGQAS